MEEFEEKNYGGRPRKLTVEDLPRIKEIIDKHLQKTNPTFTELSRLLKIHPDTLYRNTDREDEIGELLLDAYLYIAQKHEENLYNSGCAGSIFRLKTLKKHLRFNEEKEVNEDNNINLTFNVVDKKIDEN